MIVVVIYEAYFQGRHIYTFCEEETENEKLQPNGETTGW